MPGLVGCAGDHNKDEAKTLLTNMALALQEEDWYQLDLHHGEGCGLGRVTLGISNPEPQPIWNEDETLAIVMEGEVFDYRNLKQHLITRGHRFQVDNDAEFVLHLYEEFGEGMPTKLNGAFVLAIWDRRAGKLLLANDRLGLCPLYYAQRNGRLMFASGVRALLADSNLPRRVDLLAIAQLLAFDHVLHERTLLTDAHLLPPASLLIFSNGQLTIEPYWTLKYPEFHQPLSEEAYLEDLIFYLRQAVTRQAPGDLPAGVLLSGGLDSRALLGFLCDGPATRPLHTFTFGIPGCDDARFAHQVSSRVGAQHHFFEMRPGYLLELAEKGVRLTDGLENCRHMNALATLSAQAEYAQVFYKGFLGDALMGYFTHRLFLANYDENGLMHLFLDRYPFVFSPVEQQQLFAQSLLPYSSAALDTCRAALAESQARLVVDRISHFDLHQRQRRMTLNGVRLVRSRGIVRTPFCDKDLIDFVLRTPCGLRFERYLMKQALVRTFPDLAKVPYTETGFPLAPCLRDSLMRINRQVRWRLRAAGLGWVPIAQPRPYADYDVWFRSVLRGWVEETLLDSRSLQRGYFRPKYVKQLVSEHMAGADHATKLGALLALELWHRQFID
jgi:asparagine synthase (glutamine-hydrolysing)